MRLCETLLRWAQLLRECFFRDAARHQVIDDCMLHDRTRDATIPEGVMLPD